LGQFDVTGKTIKPATITIAFTDLSREEYLSTDALIDRIFKELGVPIHLQKLQLSKNDPVHNGGNPTNGGPNK
jgi:hypothetical protein